MEKGENILKLLGGVIILGVIIFVAYTNVRSTEIYNQADETPVADDISLALTNNTEKDIGDKLADNDNDGLINIFEDIYNTNKNLKDSDGDGFDDYSEIENGFDPSSSGELNLENTLVDKQGEEKIAYDDCTSSLKSLNEKQECLKELAIQEKNKKYCEEIDYPLKTNSCLIEVAVVSGNYALCQSGATVQAIENCEMRTERTNPKKEYCDKIVNASTKKQCLQAYAVGMNDYESCELLGDKLNINRCIREVAKKIGPAICEKISDLELKDWCYVDFVYANYSADVCYLVMGSEQRDNCFSSVATENNNPELCGEIDNPLKKEECNLRSIDIKGDKPDLQTYLKERIVKNTFSLKNIIFRFIFGVIFAFIIAKLYFKFGNYYGARFESFEKVFGATFVIFMANLLIYLGFSGLFYLTGSVLFLTFGDTVALPLGIALFFIVFHKMFNTDYIILLKTFLTVGAIFFGIGLLLVIIVYGIIFIAVSTNKGFGFM